MPDPVSAVELHIQWQFGPNGYIDAGTLSLVNAHLYSLERATLCVSGMVRFTDATPVSGAVLVSAMSNYAVFSPEPDNLPDRTWRFKLGEPDYPMRHYTEGLLSAYLCLHDGSLVDVPVTQVALQAGERLEQPTMLYSAQATYDGIARGTWCITPYPNEVALSGRAVAPTGLHFMANEPMQQQAVAAFINLAENLFPDERWYRPNTLLLLRVQFRQSPNYKPEQYSLAFDAGEVLVQASGHVGYLYGLISLGQLVRASACSTSVSFPASGVVNDQPAHQWRGCHLDVARQFYAADTVEQLLNVLAWNKLNRFHWHLSDDEAWRVEIRAYPPLTEIGAWRGHGKPIPPVLGAGAEISGGFYTQQQISRVVTTARGLGIVVIPEFDMPGHCFAALQSIPTLADPLEPASYRSLQGFLNNCLNPVLEQTYTFIERVFDELLPLFPDQYWHIGADEVPDTAWHAAPSVNASNPNKHQSQTAQSLQAQFLRRVQAMLVQRGFTTGAWQEAAIQGGIGVDNSYLIGWLDTQIAKQLADRGYKVVVSAGQAYYLDMAMADDWSEPGLGWAGSVNLKQTYDYDPTDGWSAELLPQCLGVQACIWSEQMTNQSVFDYLVFPRLSAMAETAWTYKRNKNWNRFSTLCITMPRLFNT